MISYLHSGSIYAPLLDIDMKTDDEAPVMATDSQKRLVDYFHEFWRWVGDYDFVFDLGDSTEGQNRKEFGEKLSSVRLIHQIDNAERLLGPYFRGKKVWKVKGSRYHQGDNFSTDEELHRRYVSSGIDCDYVGILGNIELEGTGKRIQIRHGDGGKSVYFTQLIDRENGQLDMAEGRGDIRDDNGDPYHIDAMLMGHHHRSVTVDFIRSKRICHVNPCWKTWFPYRSGFHGEYVNPSIGGSRMIVTKKEIKIETITFPAPCIGTRIHKG